VPRQLAQVTLVLRRGKGNKDRRVFLGEGVAAPVADWLVLRGRAPGPLFHPINKAGQIDERRLSAQAVYAILRKRAPHLAT